MTIPDNIKPYLDRSVAVLGYGVSGRGLVALLRACGIWYEVYDEYNGEARHSEFDEGRAKQHGLVLYSPGFSKDHRWLVNARNAGCRVLGELDFASLFWSGAFVAITGTNGKTTTAEFLSFAMKRIGMKAVAVGNVGYPVSRLHEIGNYGATTAVCEVSSFQSEAIEYLRPQALLWTNFGEDHLDRYDSMKDYFAAKWKLVERLARPRFIVGRSVAEYAVEFGYTLPSFCQIVDVDEQNDLIPVGSCFNSYPQRENYLIIRAFWQQEGLSLKALEEAACQFQPPRHRLGLVQTIGETEFWNDSKATNFASSLAALKSFDRPILWIGGGKSKGGDVADFARSVGETISKGYLIGESAGELAANFMQNGVDHEVFTELEDAVAAAYKDAKGRAIVLLSPGFSSFDLFSSYSERGIRFEKAVLSLMKQSHARKSKECAVTSEKSQ
ncbi:UDP-N-acetylmuramoyl-L-alanine--D-glutamate ligase [Rubellicoccus peritrichatus]|uniref:UDP-N-acetylmuramoylalanine--D-glutamate ligase n=1 Tax=Rubellicoccus peritrichatus TaxID=3080537 RepID=A0AAQ3LD65_9BACT|nr:UDP-N-acetylmuramoyl-L-alanine--D-glutamate ligase [Puniceicoccus sp. CR14]WOO43550.1 UDP-N-acetylmuramoyl-L-alanine--D-glutamate ligase [Puniceicoccus sp. CR14]